MFTLGPDNRTISRRTFALRGPYLMADDGTPGGGAGGHEGDPPVGDEKPEGKPDGKPEGITNDIQEYFKSIIAREVRDAKRSAADEARRQADEEKARLAAEAQRKKDEDAGEYEKVKGELISERDALRTERDSLQTERDSLREFFDAQFASAVDDLPDIVKAFKPDDDASFEEKKRWLVTAQEQAKTLTAEPKKRGAGPNPPPRIDANRDVDDEVAKARVRSTYSSF